MGKEIGTAYQQSSTVAEEDVNGQVSVINERWFVRTAFAAGIDTALAATGLPANNSTHPDYPALRVSKREPTQDPSGIKWTFDITYSIVNEDDAVNNQKLVTVEYGTHELQEDVTHNLGTGAVIVDGNGKPFNQTIQVPRSYPFIRINKMQATVSRSDVLGKSGTINNANIVVAGVTIVKHTGYLKIYATETENDQYPWDISYEVSVRNNDVSNYIDFAGALQAGPLDFGWDEGIINQGFYIGYVPGSGIPGPSRATEVVILDDGTEEERPSASPVLLDENGDKLAEGAEPISVQVQVYPESDWSGLGLNTL